MRRILYVASILSMFGLPAFAADAYTHADPIGAQTAPEPESSLEVTGRITVSGRMFQDSPLYANQVGGVLPLVEGSVRFDFRSSDGKSRFAFEPYGRLDARGGTDLIDLRDAYYLYDGGGWDVLAGVHTVFWGVAESRKLVNVINQRDLGEVFKQDRVLGQPMVNLNWSSEQAGTLRLYGLFGFRSRDHPDIEDRLRPAMVVNDTAAIYEADGAARHLGFAARYENQFDLGPGGLDVGASYFHGTSRESRFMPVGMNLVPIYDVMDQIGVDAVYAQGDVQLKFEGIWRHANSNDFFATVAGFEYALPAQLPGGAEVSLLGEYLFDGRSSNPAIAPPTAYQNDIFGGVRVEFNDVRGTRILAGMTHDLDNSAKSASLEFETRLSDDLLFEIQGRVFWDGAAGPFMIPNEDSFVWGKLTKYF